MKRFLKKLTSIKNLLTIWACFLVTYIVIKNKVEFYGIALTLCWVCLSYFAVNEIQKYIFRKEVGKENEDTCNYEGLAIHL